MATTVKANAVLADLNTPSSSVSVKGPATVVLAGVVNDGTMLFEARYDSDTFQPINNLAAVKETGFHYVAMVGTFDFRCTLIKAGASTNLTVRIQGS